MPVRKRASMRAQAALEYLSTYGFATLIVVAALAVLYFFVIAPQGIVPFQCVFASGVNCNILIIGSNSTALRAVLLLSNAQAYSLQNPSVSLNISGNTVSGACNPFYLLPGGAILCSLTSTKTLSPGALATGNIYLNTNVCTQISTTGCAGPQSQTYVGSFSGHVAPLSPTPSCSITLTAKNTTQFANGGKDPITANVKLLGYAAAGATVNFASNTTSVGISPSAVNTDSNGNATTYASSTTAVSAGITASFAGCSSSTRVLFVTPVYVTFAMNQPNTGALLLTLDGVQYTSLPVRYAYAYGSTRNYAYNTTVFVANQQRYLYSTISGCGATQQSAALAVSSNCTVTAYYNIQYYVTTSANPSNEGSASPASNWFNAGSQITISANPAYGYYPTGWSCTGNGCYSGSAQSATITVNNPMTETANFAALTLTMSSSSSSCGSVSPGSGPQAYGSQVAISATPNAGCSFTGWSCTGNGCYSGNSQTATIVMNDPITETANFQLTPTYTLTTTTTSVGGGYVSPAGTTGPYSSGASVTITATPVSGYIFVGWSCTGNGCYSGSANSASVTMLDNIIETATFQQSSATTTSSTTTTSGVCSGSFTVTTTTGPNGGGYVSPAGTTGPYSCGSSVTITATPVSGYIFTGWSCTGRGCYAGSSPSATITGYDEGIIETANFQQSSATTTSSTTTSTTSSTTTSTTSSTTTSITITISGSGGGIEGKSLASGPAPEPPGGTGGTGGGGGGGRPDKLSTGLETCGALC